MCQLHFCCSTLCMKFRFETTSLNSYICEKAIQCYQLHKLFALVELNFLIYHTRLIFASVNFKLSLPSALLKFQVAKETGFRCFAMEALQPWWQSSTSLMLVQRKSWWILRSTTLHRGLVWLFSARCAAAVGTHFPQRLGLLLAAHPQSDWSRASS